MCKDIQGYEGAYQVDDAVKLWNMMKGADDERA